MREKRYFFFLNNRTLTINSFDDREIRSRLNFYAALPEVSKANPTMRPMDLSRKGRQRARGEEVGSEGGSMDSWIRGVAVLG